MKGAGEAEGEGFQSHQITSTINHPWRSGTHGDRGGTEHGVPSMCLALCFIQSIAQWSGMSIK